MPRNRIRSVAVAAALGTALAGAGLLPASANPVDGAPTTDTASCSASTSALSYSDALDKLVIGDQEVGGLSDLAWDQRAHSYVSTVDNNDTDPSLLWFLGSDLSNPQPVGDPLVLRHADGTPYTGETADNEGLAVLPDGRYVVSSEVEPSIRIFGRDGVEQQSLPVPSRFAVAPAGQAKQNATFEGLTVSHDGRTLIVATEGTLSGDTGGADTGEGDLRRLLVYTKRQRSYQLTRQIGYRVDAGMRIPEIAEYAPGKLLVLEAAWSAETGNTIRLYATDVADAPDVTDDADLADAPDDVVGKTPVADVTNCPDLGATSKELQTNPLMDNYEAMTVGKDQHGSYPVTLLSDDNFNPDQTTRVLNLEARLP